MLQDSAEFASNNQYILRLEWYRNIQARLISWWDAERVVAIYRSLPQLSRYCPLKINVDHEDHHPTTTLTPTTWIPPRQCLILPWNRTRMETRIQLATSSRSKPHQQPLQLGLEVHPSKANVTFGYHSRVAPFTVL